MTRQHLSFNHGETKENFPRNTEEIDISGQPLRLQRVGEHTSLEDWKTFWRLGDHFKSDPTLLDIANTSERWESAMSQNCNFAIGCEERWKKRIEMLTSS
jgi:hypothetical protein